MGVPGELYIGGQGVAKGYLNRDELSATQFVANPFSEHDDALMYRTGDLGRWRADGNLEYLGRNDGQVKIRGFRIELSEIETVLATHPAVQEVVLLARQDSGENAWSPISRCVSHSKRWKSKPCAAICKPACRTTWCPQLMCASTRCH